ncbi:TMEM165/GDT1 family protein [Aldersonia sp. NBC_00410]|uniref:TMEM165/GDT1 family protein n=1 Tax=Aldersonia sp. NBC_00410 TaxID=2975954 RepID=UPI002251B7FB|nr:TMEM165/GDT1 family protein [Aldersonia sp. NBC_00410]MCX5045122.1 TMEM165/GDT1 family protein [Aldersonia sp. NBC_00410]
MLAALLLSFGVIFVAELGDKSQLMAMTFALRYRWWVVLGAITIATAAVHLVSVAIGYFLGAALPTHAIGIAAGIAFLAFGVWTLRGDSLSEDEQGKAGRTNAPAFFAVMSAFLLAELGDKTMLATVTLAADHDWVGVWIGSTIGMVAADALAILIGALAGKHLPERVIALVAGALFLLFGGVMLVDSAAPDAALLLQILGGVAIAAAVAGLWFLIQARLRGARLRSRAVPTDTDGPSVEQHVQVSSRTSD